MKYYQIKNWSDFQHYKDRNPPWIKLSTSLFQDYEFACLQDASKLLALCIWTLASRYKDPKLGLVPADFDYIKRQGNLGDWIQVCHLEELVKAGFLIDASDLLASCKQVARPETETEAEAETKSSSKKEGSKKESLKNPYDDDFNQIEKILGKRIANFEKIAQWRKEGIELKYIEAAINLALERNKKTIPSSMNYFDGIVQELKTPPTTEVRVDLTEREREISAMGELNWKRKTNQFISTGQKTVLDKYEKEKENVWWITLKDYKLNKNKQVD